MRWLSQSLLHADGQSRHRGRTRDDRRHDSYQQSELWSEHNSEFGFTDDPWGWVEAREDGEEARLDVSSAHVTAVLVTLDAARWLPYTLEALEHLQDRPHRLIAIDNASSDITLTLLEHARDQGIIDAVYSGKRTFGFGTAVKSALRQDRQSLDEDPTTSGIHAVSADDSHWLWLLHDDAVPAPDALHQLLAHVITDPIHRHHRSQAGAAQAPARRPADQ